MFEVMMDDSPVHMPRNNTKQYKSINLLISEMSKWRPMRLDGSPSQADATVNGGDREQ